MNLIKIETDMMMIKTGEKDSFIDLINKKTGMIYSFEAPIFEIDMNIFNSRLFTGCHFADERKMANSGSEVRIDYFYEDLREIILSVYLQYFPESPFVRYRYSLHAKNNVLLTKHNGKDNIKYTAITSEISKQKTTEIQFSQFNPNVHSYNPSYDIKREGELSEGCNFQGPIVLVEEENRTFLLAYEHGAQYPDTYLMFYAKKENDQLKINIHAEKGNYYNGESINKKNPFVSPWFHFAECVGDSEMLFKYYREFFLKYICENNFSRKPYIFYNTWNYQERVNCIKGKKYLDEMNLERILEEIDIAYRMGVDVFVIDTGWFEKTGEWTVNLKRFPDGLSEIKNKLAGYGMQLGLWLNPTVAAITTDIVSNHPEYRLEQNGRNISNEVWESEESYFMCLGSDYTEYFIEKMIYLHREIGVTYFKWDGIGQYGCNSPYHKHGNESNTSEERFQCYSYKIGMEMIRIVEEVTKQCPNIIVDFDVTEGGRFVGLGFLSVGKYFLINNGPYAMDFDLPEKMEIATNKLAVNLSPYTNMFFFPGAARSRICRQGTLYDFFIPSILFLTHFLPDGPRISQNNNLASLMLGGNGIWGDLLSLSKEDIEMFKINLKRYKMVAEEVTSSYPLVKGFIGSSPEIYEKIDHKKAKGIICFFTKFKGTYTHITEKINIKENIVITGADKFKIITDGRLKITVKLDEDDAKIVFLT